MDTNKENSPEPSRGGDHDLKGETAEEKGFFGLLVQSIFEPGANNAVILAMNVSFFLLLIVLFGLAFLTSWNFHVVMMLVVSTCLWGAMIWFVIEMQKIPDRPDNMPQSQLDTTTEDTGVDATVAQSILEDKKDR